MLTKVHSSSFSWSLLRCYVSLETLISESCYQPASCHAALLGPGERTKNMFCRPVCVVVIVVVVAVVVVVLVVV